MYRLVLNFAKSCILPDNKKWVHPAVFEIYVVKAKLRGFLAGHTAAMVTSLITACSPMTGQFFDNMFIAPTD